MNKDIAQELEGAERRRLGFRKDCGVEPFKRARKDFTSTAGPQCYNLSR